MSAQQNRAVRAQGPTDSATAPLVDDAALRELAQDFRGQLLGPADPTYDAVRQVWNAMIDKRPAVIARCTGTPDVVSALRFARAHGLEISVRGGGHSIVGHSVTDGGLMIDLSSMAGVKVDPDTRTATVQGGALWSGFDHEAQRFGLATTGGVISHTGVGGLTLGGGYGWLARRAGLACDNLIAAEVVTADGAILQASSETNPDLFWGLRGGGGNFGIVTRFEFRLHELKSQAVSADIVYPADEGLAMLRIFRDFAAEAPVEMTCVAWIGAARSWPFLSASWHGRPVVILAFAFLGDTDTALRFGAPLRGPKQIAEAIEEVDYVTLQGMGDASHAKGIARRYWKSHFIRELPDAALETFLTQGLAVAEESKLCGAELVQLGGAIGRVGEGDSAFSHRDVAFDFIATVGWERPEEDGQHMASARKLGDAMAPYAIGVYANNLGNEGQARVQAAYGPAKYERLAALKRKYDPDNIFHLNQNITPASSSN